LFGLLDLLAQLFERGGLPGPGVPSDYRYIPHLLH
jgi:hypothetical protein